VPYAGSSVVKIRKNAYVENGITKVQPKRPYEAPLQDFIHIREQGTENIEQSLYIYFAHYSMFSVHCSLFTYLSVFS